MIFDYVIHSVSEILTFIIMIVMRLAYITFLVVNEKIQNQETNLYEKKLDIDSICRNVLGVADVQRARIF
jgi:hypothetical protein